MFGYKISYETQQKNFVHVFSDTLIDRHIIKAQINATLIY